MNDLQNIPAELRALPQWVGYKLVPSKKRPGKTDKIPINPHTGENASSTDPATWGMFAEACAAVARYQLAGVGYVLTEADRLVCVDLDNQVDADGRLTPAAQAMVDRLASYTELSQSGTGLHIFARGTLPPTGRVNHAAGVEMYDTGRFIAMTGNVLSGREELAERQAELTALHAEVFAKRTPPQTQGQPRNLADAELLNKLRECQNGKYAGLLAGNTTGYKSASEADLALVHGLAFYAGGDAGTVDRLFRQSGLYRAKWDEKRNGQTYGALTIARALDGMTEFYQGNGHAPRETTTQEPAPGRRVKSADLVQFLNRTGYTFRLNTCDDSVEVNGERITDVVRAEMRCKLRDRGFAKHLAAAEDAWTAEAGRRKFHPVRDYLAGLTWSGDSHIAHLAQYVTDTNGVFGLYLRKWLIGAVARAYTGSQNAVFVLDGKQGLGKSQLARWLCPLPGLFVDASINPDDKDASLLAMRNWIWEVSELGATTKRADIEALKGFLSREVFTLRPAYAHYDVTKPGLVSFIGTVNNSSGIFADPTGSRRYLATTLTGIDWRYATEVDVNQVWAEAYDAYTHGEMWTLTADEATQAREINATYAVVDPVEDLLRKHFELDPEDRTQWTSSADILTTLQNNGLGTNAHANAMKLSATLKRLGFEKVRSGFINGYSGVWGKWETAA